LRGASGTASATIPEKVREPLGIFPGAHIGVHSVGPCIVLFRLTDVTREGAPEEAAKAFEAAIAAWERRKVKQ